MSTYDQEIFPWLQANFGDQSIAPLTGTDTKALIAAWRILVLWNYDSNPGCDALLGAYAVCVKRMQPHTRDMAYHSIAMVLDWRNCASVWAKAGLPPINPRPRLRA